MTDNQYGFSLQYVSVENYKLRDFIFNGDIYTNGDKFVSYVNEQIIDCVYDMEDVDITKLDMSEFTSNYNLDCYPITIESLNNMVDDYIYYPDDCSWGWVICKHRII